MYPSALLINISQQDYKHPSLFRAMAQIGIKLKLPQLQYDTLP
jgi:hypothetical protein